MKISTRQDRTGIIESLYRYEAQHADMLIEEMAKRFWPIIGTANQCAFLAIDDAMEAMYDAGMMRQQVKQKALKAMQEYERYDKAARQHFSETGDDRYCLWADIVTRGAEWLQPDVTRLYYAVKQRIDAERVRNSVALAKIQTALALVTLATLMFDTLAEQYQRQTMVRIADTFRGGRLTAVERNWKEVGYLTGSQVKKDVDLQNDQQCALGVQVILTRYQSAEFLNEVAGEALRLNPEIERKYCNEING